MILVPVLPDKNGRAWPASPTGMRAEYLDVGNALQRRYTSNAHFAAYSLPGVERRLAGAAPEQSDGGVPMVLAIFDIDGAGHDASELWRVAERAKVRDVLASWAGLVAYETRGGYRLMGALPAPFVIRTQDDRAAWTRLYLHGLAYLSRKFGIVGDPACADWTRLYRLPHATRELARAPEERPVYGDAGALGPWPYEPCGADLEADVAEVRRLAGLLPAWEAALKHFAPALRRARAATSPPNAANGPWNGGYLRVAVDRELAAVRGAAEGLRNQTLNRAAHSLGQLVGAGALAREVIERELEQAGQDAGLGDSEIAATVQSGLAAGEKQPRDLPQPPSSRVGSAAATSTRPTGGGFTLTDTGNARRLVAAHGNDLRYVHPWRRWMVYDGRRWVHDEHGEIQRRSAGVAALLDDEVRQAEDERRSALRKWASASESARGRSAMVELAKSEREVVASPSEFDRARWLLNVANGTLELRTGNLRPHDRGDLITKFAPVTYDAAAAAPRWERFLEEILPSAELRAFIQRAVGHCLTGDTTEHAFFIAHGTGANGKSVFFETFKAILGDYAQTAAQETFTASRDSDRVPNDLASMAGARLVTVSETDDGRRLDEALVKQVTGGDEVRARFMRGEWFEFRPAFKPWLATNHRPEVRGTDHGIWRRLRFIPFEVTISEERRDRRLAEKLRAELPGILAWAVRGCLVWQREGLGTAPEVARAAAQYRDQQDRLGPFLADCCRIEPTAWVSCAELRRRYEDWAKTNGESPMATRGFNGRLRDKGIREERESAGERARGWRGIKVAEAWELGQTDEARSGTVPVFPDNTLREIHRESPADRRTRPGRPAGGQDLSVHAEAPPLADPPAVPAEPWAESLFDVNDADWRAGGGRGGVS